MHGETGDLSGTFLTGCESLLSDSMQEFAPPRRSSIMDHLIITLPAAVVEASEDADPTLSAFIQRTPLGWWSLLGGPLLGVVALSASPLAAVGTSLLGSSVIFGLLVIGHASHRRAIESDPRTPQIRTAAALVTDFNALAPRLDALIRFPPPATAELFSLARRLRMDVQGIVGQADATVQKQPRLGQTGPRRTTIQPLKTTNAGTVRKRIEALSERLTEEESLPPDVLRFPKQPSRTTAAP